MHRLQCWSTAVILDRRLDRGRQLSGQRVARPHELVLRHPELLAARRHPVEGRRGVDHGRVAIRADVLRYPLGLLEELRIEEVATRAVLERLKPVWRKRLAVIDAKQHRRRQTLRLAARWPAAAPGSVDKEEPRVTS